MKRKQRLLILSFALLAMLLMFSGVTAQDTDLIGSERGLLRHLEDGEEFLVSLLELIEHGRQVFTAAWTPQDGGGRPLTKGTGGPLSDPSDPLVFPRSFNRISAPDANSCAGCHNAPFGIAGGGGDFVTNVFVLAQRFDFATFDPVNDFLPTKGAVDESGNPVTLQSISNFRSTLGMFGSGFIEMLARQITADLQTIRDSMAPGDVRTLESKGIHYGALARNPDGTWDASGVEGLPAPSLVTTGANAPPSLIIRPFHQAGAVVSLREFTNNAMNHHHGIQSTERFGLDTDPDGDGVTNELTRADVTAASVFQATLPIPGRVIPNHPALEQAILDGEELFDAIGCSSCHIKELPLDNGGWIFSEPNPFNPPGNLRPGEAPVLEVDLTDKKLPGPRLEVDKSGVVMVPAFTDLKLHDITAGPDDRNAEALDQTQPPGSAGFFAGNRRFLTKKLWGSANEPPFFHHGFFTTLRESVLAHAGDAEQNRQAFEALSAYEQDSVIEFLKSLQVLPPGAKGLVVDEKGNYKKWPPPGKGPKK